MSLSGYINAMDINLNTVNEQLVLLRKEVTELRRENRELRDLLIRRAPALTTEEMVEDLIRSSNRPDYLKFR